MPEYHFPPIEYLKERQEVSKFQRQEFAQSLAEKLDDMFRAFQVDARHIDCRCNAFSILIRIKLGSGVKTGIIRNMRSDIEYQVGNPVELMENPVNGTFDIAVKNFQRPVIPLREVIQSREFQSARSNVTVAAGIDLFGSYFTIDLATAPNMLVAGVTGSGKSTYLSDIILSILYKARPDEVKFLMMDMKGVELTAFNGIPHLLMDVITDADTGMDALRWLKNEAEQRLNRISVKKVKNLEELNSYSAEKLPRIVMIVDEYMEFTKHASREFNDLILFISRHAARTGIHLILATQRPSSEVITEEIKALIPCRTAFVVVDEQESKIIIDRSGAERLTGQGDMIFTRDRSGEGVHGQAAFVSFAEIDRIIEFVRNEKGFFGNETIALREGALSGKE